jgi:hypothetical protein
VTWTALLAERRVAREGVDRAEIERYLALVDSRLTDAGLVGLSADGRFTAAYDAARTLAVIAIRVCGYRVLIHGGGHRNTFLAVRAWLEKEHPELLSDREPPREVPKGK